MSTYTAVITWRRDDAAFVDNRYSRGHVWAFDGGAEVRASSSPSSVPAPLSDPSGVDPEEAFVASLSSCHMLWFLSIAAKQGWLIDGYVDHAVGYMEKNEEGRPAMTRVVLRPLVTFATEVVPAATQLRELHDRAHHECYIANSVRTVVTVELPPEQD
ncbi:MAG TPA: OsmC family protein [Gemmatimonadaceae bacterium]|nr:OsmC family protein [Gemmatimonadaceae bacterium]